MVKDDDARFAQLYPRQLECLRLTYDRKTSKEIADALGISVGTTDRYIADAVRAMGARNRRDASEKLWHYEQIRTPCKVEGYSSGISDLPPTYSHPSTGTVAFEAKVLPLRQKDVIANDLTIFQRIIWVPAIAIACAVGFGALASGLHVISDFLGTIAGFKR